MEYTSAENKTDLRYLEEEFMSSKNDALEEEKENVTRNYGYFQKKLKYYEDHVPFPDIKEDEKPVDYDEAYDLNRKKQKNMENLEAQQKYRLYCTTGKLCCGHVKRAKADFFLTDVKGLHSINLTDDKQNVMLINTDDRRYQDILVQWRYPDQDESVDYSRNIITRNKKVVDVDVVLDRTDGSEDKIRDAFLKQALKRNKNNEGITSIIQTIQAKQDNVRIMPSEASFIIQGCAGSGKTMVLLHRLRYLLYNQDIQNSQYVLLVPSNEFKDFIRGITDEFEIYHRNIMPYTDYYKSMLGKKSVHEEKNELLLSEEMLTEVYSKDFIRTCYKNTLDDIRIQNQSLLDSIEEILGRKLEEYKNEIEKAIRLSEITMLEQINNLTVSFNSYLITGKVHSIENVGALRLEIRQLLKEQEKNEEKKKSIHLKSVEEDDERVLNDPKIKAIQQEMNQEQEAFDKATIFSRGIHRRRLNQISVQLETAKNYLIQKLSKDDYNSAFSDLKEAKVFSYVTFDNLKVIYDQISTIYNETSKSIHADKKRLENIEMEHIPQFLLKSSNAFSNLYDYFALFCDVKDCYADDLIPIYDYLPEYMKIIGNKLKVILNDICNDEDIHKMKELSPDFVEPKENEINNWLSDMMMIKAQQILSDKYQENIDDSYKYYWYMLMYFTYLSSEVVGRLPNHLFIDEAQDLSSAELELLYRLHTKKENDGSIVRPIMNLFGDTNQTITDYGIRYWNEVPFISSVIKLDENFRNTNQIVDYCNDKLKMNMTKVGVDMSNVQEYASIHDYVNEVDDFEKTILVVKDDNYKNKILNDNSYSGTLENVSIYTVKKVKGLEFRKVIVLSKGMTRNERYIAYTRALSELIVVKDF